MQFRVPQFIDMEDKVFGPFTLKQFGYMVGAGGFSFLIWTFIPIKFFAILLIIPVAGLFLALAFAKFNNRTFGEFLESAFTYYTSSKVYTWKQPELQKTESSVDRVVADTQKEIIISKTNKDKIHDISLGLDVFENNSQKDERI
jgi:asparagine N-glycosylation enzyme membrane subunit Stt3